MDLIRSLIEDEMGAALTEYALLVALIAVALVGTLQIIGGAINGVFGTTSTTFGAS